MTRLPYIPHARRRGALPLLFSLVGRAALAAIFMACVWSFANAVTLGLALSFGKV